MRLLYKLPLNVFFIIIAPIIVVFFVTYQMLHAHMEGASTEKLKMAAKVRHEQIGKFFSSHETVMRLLTSEPQLVDILERKSFTKEHKAKLTVELADTDGLFDSIEAITLFDANKNMIASSNASNVKDALDAIRDNDCDHVAYSVSNVTDKPKIELIQTVKNDGKNIGYIALTIPIAKLMEFAESNIGYEVVMAIWSSGNDAYYLGKRQFAKSDEPILQKVNLKMERLAMVYALKGVKGFSHDYVDYRGEPIVSYTEYLSKYKIGIVVKSDIREMHAQMNNILTILLIGFFMLCLLVGASVWVALRSFTLRLEKDTQVADEIAFGDFDKRIEETHNDELGRFGKAFNGMVDTLVHIKQNLQDEVDKQVTQIKTSMEAAHKEEGLFKNTFETASIGLAHAGCDGKFIRANNYLCNLFEYAREELLTVNVSHLTYPDDLEEELLRIDDVLSGKSDSYMMQKRCVTKSGKIIWVFLSASLVRDHLGAPSYFVGAVQDVTHIKELEIKNRELLEQNRLLLESSVDGIIGIGLDGLVTFANAAANTILGYEDGYLVGRHGHRLLHNKKPDGKEYPVELCPVTSTILRGEVSAQEGDYFISKAGDFIPVEFSSTPIYKGNKIIGAVVVFRDVTFRKALEETILKSEQKFRNLVESTSDWIWETDDKGVYTYVSPQAEKLLGYKQKEIVGRSCFDFVSPKYVQEIRDEFEKIVKQKGVIKNLINVCMTKDGTEVYLETNGVPIIDDGGNLIGYEGIDRDVTERTEKEKLVKAQEQMLIAQSRQAAMGELIGMIAHQWRQPITAIGMAINNLKADIELDMLTPLVTNSTLNDMSSLIEHLSKTIDDFRDFFKEDKEKELVSIDEVIHDTLHIIEKSLVNNNIELRMALNAPVEFEIFKREMIQVFLNIIKNAKDIIQERGIANPYISVTSNQNDTEVTISICDNAGGIPEEVMPKIFEPYFTTRGPTSGTGLGLYMSDIIVSRHHRGRIDVHNSDNGACFVVVMPRQF